MDNNNMNNNPVNNEVLNTSTATATKSSAGLIIGIVAIVAVLGVGAGIFFLNNNKKESEIVNTTTTSQTTTTSETTTTQNSTTTSTTTTTTTTTTTKATEEVKEPKKLYYYGSKDGSTKYYEKEQKDKELAITITCKYSECTPETTDTVGRLGEIYVHDGNYISVFDYDGNVLAYDIGKGVLDNLKNYSATLLNVEFNEFKLTDTVFLVTNDKNTSLFIYNATKNKYSKLYENIKISYVAEPEDDFEYACSGAVPFGYLAFYDQEKKEYIIFDINNNKELDFRPKEYKGLEFDQDKNGNSINYRLEYDKNKKYIIKTN